MEVVSQVNPGAVSSEPSEPVGKAPAKAGAIRAAELTSAATIPARRAVVDIRVEPLDKEYE
ncbi:hypothetical protein [Rhodococcus sp. 3-2]|uniref:hypothetical protein n=1 Tax=Rhodococcus sp. 3-2 TaxID=2890836 RepID=UPI001D188DF4|nr:hypothetical protein [Rhodococcus sp. 3-2]MCC4306245.1 hypothetical protein [Rhodococcus sp. 3-2]